MNKSKESKKTKETKKNNKEVSEKNENSKKIVKDTSVKSKKFTDKIIDWFEKVDENRKVIYGFAAGLLIGLLILALQPKKIASLSDGTQPVAYINEEAITADDLYEDMKDQYSVSLLINMIDNKILTEKYPEDSTMKSEVESNATQWLNWYNTYYGYDEATFLEKNNFSSRQEFIDYLTLDYRRNLYYEEYLKNQFTDSDIQKYYDEEVYGDIYTKHILVKVDSENGLTDDEAKTLATEIISKLDSGTSWDDVVEEYKDQITTEDLGYQAFNANLDEAYMNEMTSLSNDSYSKTPIKSSYGYHVVYRVDQKDKPELDDSLKEVIIEKLGEELEKSDENIQYKALIYMREEANLKFTDEDLESKYSKYVDTYK